MSKTENVLDRSAEFYAGETRFDRKLIHFRFRTLSPYIAGKNVLELGPGSGEMTKMLSEVASSLTVVEGSQLILDSIPDLPGLSKFCSFFEEFNPKVKFDAIIAEHILEHVEHPVKLLTLMKNWLQPSGFVIVGVPNSQSIHRQVAVKMGLLSSEDQLNQRDILFGHRRVYSFDLLEAQLREAGYNINNKTGIFLKPLSNSQINDQWSDEMIEGFFKLGFDYPQLCAEIQVICSIQ